MPAQEPYVVYVAATKVHITVTSPPVLMHTKNTFVIIRTCAVHSLQTKERKRRGEEEEEEEGKRRERERERDMYSYEKQEKGRGGKRVNKAVKSKKGS